MAMMIMRSKPHSGYIVVSSEKTLYSYFPCLVAGLWQKCIVPAVPVTLKQVLIQDT